MSLWTDTKRQHGGDRIAAAIQIARSLSSPDARDPFRAPYTSENALIAVCDLAEASGEPLTADEREQVERALKLDREARA